MSDFEPDDGELEEEDRLAQWYMDQVDTDESDEEPLNPPQAQSVSEKGIVNTPKLAAPEESSVPRRPDEVIASLSPGIALSFAASRAQTDAAKGGGNSHQEASNDDDDSDSEEESSSEDESTLDGVLAKERRALEGYLLSSSDNEGMDAREDVEDAISGLEEGSIARDAMTLAMQEEFQGVGLNSEPRVMQERLPVPPASQAQNRHSWYGSCCDGSGSGPRKKTTVVRGGGGGGSKKSSGHRRKSSGESAVGACSEGGGGCRAGAGGGGGDDEGYGDDDDDDVVQDLFAAAVSASDAALASHSPTTKSSSKTLVSMSLPPLPPAPPPPPPPLPSAAAAAEEEEESEDEFDRVLFGGELLMNRLGLDQDYRLLAAPPKSQYPVLLPGETLQQSSSSSPPPSSSPESSAGASVARAWSEVEHLFEKEEEDGKFGSGQRPDSSRAASKPRCQGNGSSGGGSSVSGGSASAAAAAAAAAAASVVVGVGVGEATCSAADFEGRSFDEEAEAEAFAEAVLKWRQQKQQTSTVGVGSSSSSSSSSTTKSGGGGATRGVTSNSSDSGAASNSANGGGSGGSGGSVSLGRGGSMTPQSVVGVGLGGGDEENCPPVRRERSRRGLAGGGGGGGGVRRTGSGIEDTGPRQQVEGGSLLHGTYDEAAEAKAFQASVQVWRSGGSGPSLARRTGSGTEDTGPGQQVGGGSLLHGTYDEAAEAKAFQASVQVWRSGGSGPSAIE